MTSTDHHHRASFSTLTFESLQLPPSIPTLKKEHSSSFSSTTTHNIFTSDDDLFISAKSSLNNFGSPLPPPPLSSNFPPPSHSNSTSHLPTYINQQWKKVEEEQEEEENNCILNNNFQSKSNFTTLTTNSLSQTAIMNSQIIRNNSSNSLTNSSLTYQNNNDGNKTLCSGSIMNIPNGVFHPIAAKRSYVGINNSSNGSNSINGLNQNNQSFLPLLYQQQQQQQSSRSPLYTAALTNLQQQQQIDSFPLINQPLINQQQQQSKKNSSSNNLFIGPKIAMSTATAIAVAIPPFSQTSGGGSCGESLAGDSTTGGGGGGGIGTPTKSSKSQIKSRSGFLPYHLEPIQKSHRGELSINEKYRYDLSRAQLKASSRTSALLSGFAMIALVELQYLPDTPKPLLIMLGVVTTLLVSVHLLALMMSTCLLPYIEANGCTQDSPHIKLRFYIELSWFFSTCVGLLLFLLEIGVIFFVKFNAIGYIFAAYITTGMLVPVLIIFIVISYLIHRNRFTHSIERVSDKVVDLQKYLCEAEAGNIQHAPSTIKNSGIGVNNLRNYKE
uniref:Protein orai n=1 Tax=Meloidogyne floridensis TaxID=298350 RepID=A0A915NK53_9BILA